MSNTEKDPHKDPRKANREKRLAMELRANLARRKEQARSRRAGGADEREDGIPVATKTRKP